MKIKISALLIALTLVIGISSCSEEENKGTPTDTQSISATTTETPTTNATTKAPDVAPTEKKPQIVIIDKANWEVDASHYWDPEAQWYEIRNKEIAVDGDNGETFSSAEFQTVGMWYKIDMKEVKKINSFEINYAAGGFSPGVALYVATDEAAWNSPAGGVPTGGELWTEPGSIWTKAGEIQATGDGSNSVDFTMTDARYVIIVITEPRTDSHWCFNEVTAYSVE